jgi:PadR family transcriptional regulator, regulatory protein PadR
VWRRDLLPTAHVRYYLGNREEHAVSKPADLVQGTLDLLILKILALEPLNGWAVGERLKQVSRDVLQVSDGSLYPALHKLEHQGWIASEWRASENNRRSKVYSLTRAGRGHLEREAANWRRLAGAITAVVKLREV